MRLLLDTSTFIWAIGSPDRLSKRAATAMEPQEVIAEVSAICLSEIAVKYATGKLNLAIDAVRAGIQDFNLRVLPYTATHAYQLYNLPLHHRDPFDRMIIAQALAEGIPIVTSDSQFRKYRDLKVIW